MGRPALWTASAVFFIAAALRLAYLAQIGSLPSVEFPMVDAKSYDTWARAIADGDWIGDRIFYQAPLYPYFLGAIYRCFGQGGMTAQLAQAFLGASSCVLLFLATRRMFGSRAGLAAGLLLAGYAPAIFFDGMIQKTSLGLFLTTGLLALVTGADARPTALRAASIGIVCGLLALTRENALVFVVIVPAWLFLRVWRARDPAETSGLAAPVASGAACVLGVVLVLLPVGLRNLSVGDSFAITTAQLGPNFYIGNNAAATGLYAPLMPGRQTPDFEGRDARRAALWESGHDLTPGEVSDYWLEKSLDWVRRDPGAFGALLLRKLLYTLNDYEIPDTEDIYVHAEFSWLLSGLHRVLRFGLLFPLACMGAVFAFRERAAGACGARSLDLVAAMAALFALAVAIFYVWARYRFPLVPLLLPFAGLAIARALDVVSGVRHGLVAPALALLVGGLVANATLFDRELLSQTAWINFGNAMLHAGRLEQADAYYDRAAAIPGESAELELQRAALRLQQGRTDAAVEHLRRQIEIEPTDFRGHRALGRLLRERGEAEQGNWHLRESVRLSPDRKRRGRPGAPVPRARAPLTLSPPEAP